MRLNHRRAGFTLVEVVVTVAIVASLLSFAVYNYLESVRRQKGRTCGMNLQLIEDAKAKWKIDFPGVPLPTATDPNGISRYFVAGKIPSCPSGGVYRSVDSLGTPCTCSLNFVANSFSTRIEMRAAQQADPDLGGDRATNGYHDLGYTR